VPAALVELVDDGSAELCADENELDDSLVPVELAVPLARIAPKRPR
jgi:hypothetical protein